MKRKLFIIAQVIALLAAGAMVGGTTGKALTSLAGPGGYLASADASALTIEAGAPGAPLTPTGSGFTYQGFLKSGGIPANGDHDFQFTLYDALSGGSLVSGPITRTNVPVTDGLFALSLDFGTAVFDGNARYLEIAARQSGGGSYTPLSPRQEINPVPYAVFALKSAPYKNVVTVAQAGGQFTSIQAALNSITDAATTNRYLIKVGPGTYAERVTMKAWVDIEGSGEDATKITFTGSSNPSAATLSGANNSELRSLSVENTGGNTYATAIYDGFASPSLLHVTATASGGSSYNYGVYNVSSSPNMTNVIANASGGSIQNYGVTNELNSSPNMTNVTATGFSTGGSAYNLGVANFSGSSPSIMASILSSGGAGSNIGLWTDGAGGTVTIDNSKIVGSTNTIQNGSGSTIRVGASRLSGGPVFSYGGPLTCTASYDGNNKRLGSLCTPDTKTLYVALTGGDFTTITAALNSISDNSFNNRYLIKVAPGNYIERVTMKQYVDIEGSGENETRIGFTGSPLSNTGTVIGASNAELRSLTVENNGGDTYAIAILNNGTSPSLLHVTAAANGASFENRTVSNVVASSPTMKDVTVIASGAATENIGVYNESSSPRIMASNVSAIGATLTYGVYSRFSGTMTIDNSKITGGTNTVYGDINTLARVGASQLSGGPVTGPTTCTSSYDENYVSPGLNVCP